MGEMNMEGYLGGSSREPRVRVEKKQSVLRDFREQIDSITGDLWYGASRYEQDLTVRDRDRYVSALRDRSSFITAALQSDDETTFQKAFDVLSKLLNTHLFLSDAAEEYKEYESDPELRRFATEMFLDSQKEITAAIVGERIHLHAALDVYTRIVRQTDISPAEKEQSCAMLVAHLREIEKELRQDPHTCVGYFSAIFKAGSRQQIWAALPVFERALPQISDEEERILFTTTFFVAGSLEHDELCARGEGALSPIIERYHLPVSKFWYAWRISTKPENLWHVVGDNLLTLIRLESEIPGAGEILFKEFGIMDFCRYPARMLLSQVREREDISKPYGMVLFPRDDWNGAFYGDDMALERFFNELNGEFYLRVFEAEGRVGVAKTLVKADKRYNPAGGGGHKISLLVLGGHGEKDSIRFGLTEGAGDSLQTSDLSGATASKARHQFFDEHPTIVLFSCSTGVKEGIGQELSRVLGAKVVAPKEPSGLVALHVGKRKKGEKTFRFNAEFAKGEKGVYMQGEEARKGKKKV